MTLAFNFISSWLGACSILAISSFIDLTLRPGKSFLHLVQIPLWLFTFSKSFPGMLNFFGGEVWIATDCLVPMGEGTYDIVFG